MPENAEEELKNSEAAAAIKAGELKPEKPRMICPYSKVRPGNEEANQGSSRAHKLKFKDLITLRLSEDR